MDNVEGFDWGDVGKVRIQTVVRDHNDPDNANVEERVQFVPLMIIITGTILNTKVLVTM